MQFNNNAHLALTRKLNEAEQQIVRNKYEDLFTVEENGLALEIVEKPGDLADTLNDLVDTLAGFGVAPVIGAANRYYGDADGYDVFTGEEFESMDDSEYGAWECKHFMAPEELVRLIEERKAQLLDAGYEVAITVVNTTQRIIKELAKGQKAGNGNICPRCGRMSMRTPDLFSNALSRRGDIYICPDCGQREALEDAGLEKTLPLEEWDMVRAFRAMDNKEV